MRKGFVKFVVLLLVVCILIPTMVSCSTTSPSTNNGENDTNTNGGNNSNNGTHGSQSHEHTWGEWVVVQEATCLEKGNKQRVCSGCQQTENETIEAIGHQYSDWQVTVQNTCTTPGNQTVTCSICHFQNSEVIPASGHTYGDPIQITAPTCTDKGENEKTCITCGHTEKEEVLATGHNFVNDVCSVCNAVSDDRAVQTVKITNESLLLPLNTPVKLNVQIYPENAIYEDITYTIDERNNTCGATITEDGMLSCTKLGSVRVRVTVGNVSSSYVTFNVPTEIRTAEEFNAIRNNLKGYYVLCNNIDLSSYDAWTPIGYATKSADGSLSFTGTGFQGEFNGNGYTISGLNIDLSKTELVTVGLFGFVDTSAIVSNVKISANIKGTATTSEYIGTLTGVNYGTINNCEVVSAIDMSGALYVGGIVGQNNGKLNNCVSDVGIKASNTNSSGYYVGGIAGQFQIGNMDNNTVKANIDITSCKYGYIGGVTGNTFGSFSGISCEADITVNAASSSSNISYVGGVVGKLEEAQSEIVFDLNDQAVAGAITVKQAGNIYVGGIIGYGDALKNSINEVEISVTNAQKAYVGGIAGYAKTFDNCYNKANINATNVGANYIAGIAGQSEKIINSKNYNTIIVNSNSTSYVGGIAGSTKTLDNVTNYADISVKASSAYFGGIAGTAETAQKVYNYTYELTLTGSGSFGGIIGECEKQIEDAYNTAILTVGGSSELLYVGGAVGRADATGNTIKNTVNTGKINIDVISLSVIYIGGVAGKAVSIKDSHNASTSISILTDAIANVYNAENANIGGLCGYSSGTIENCYSYASVNFEKSTSTTTSSYRSNVGGLVGKASNITSSYAIGDVDISIYNNSVFAGGLVGALTGTASNSYARGSVSGVTSSDIRIGGLAGSAESSAKIQNCYAAYGLLQTNITSYGKLAYIGGLVAENNGTVEDSYSMNYINTIGSGTSDKIYAGGVIGYNNGTVSRCYSESAFEHALDISISKDIDCTSNLSAEVYVGGFVGYNNKTINNCYAKAEVVGRGCYTGGFVGSQGTSGQIKYALALAPVNSGIAGQTLTGGFSGATAGTYTGCIFSTTGTGIDATNAAGGTAVTGILGKTEAQLLVSSVYTGFNNTVWTIANGKIAALTLNSNWKVISTTYDTFNGLVNVVNSSNQFGEISDSIVTVDFESNYPLGLPNTITFIKGSCISSMPSLYEEGYAFCGWYTDADFTKPFTVDGFYTVNENITLYAYFRKKIDKPLTHTYEYSGEEITLDTVNPESTEYTVNGTTKATNAGNYSVTLTPNKNYIWSDGTDSYTIAWKIAQPTITYNTEKTAIKVTDTIDAVLFGATAVDFVGEGSTAIPVTVRITSGSLSAGSIINVELKAVIDGVEAIVRINGIKVYATPLINYCGLGGNLLANDQPKMLFSAVDSFGNTLDFEVIMSSEWVLGSNIVATVATTDCVGNTETFTYAFDCCTLRQHVSRTDFSCTQCNKKYACAYARIDSSGNVDNDGKYILFGMYPQTEVTDDAIRITLNTLAGALPTSGNSQSWTSYGYYINGSVSNYMWYIDIEHEGETYRGVYFTSYRPYDTIGSSTDETFQYGNGYITSNVYWFKYEPIKWRILTEGSGKALILCEMLIDSQEYYNSRSLSTIDGNTVYSNNYEHSNIRAWLNDNFYNTAFNDLQKQIVQLTTVNNSASTTGNPSNPYVCNNTDDYIFLLSYTEVRNETFGFHITNTGYCAAWRKEITDYALCQGGRDYCWWLLRSPSPAGNGYYVHHVTKPGYNDYTTYSTATWLGICPALWIEL